MDPGTVQVILAIVAVLGPIMSALVGFWINSKVLVLRTQIVATHTEVAATKKDVVATKQAIITTNETIVELEKNTNAIKDALVKVTAESEFAKGLKMGTEGNTVAIVNEVAVKAARAEGVEHGMQIGRDNLKTAEITEKINGDKEHA